MEEECGYADLHVLLHELWENLSHRIEPVIQPLPQIGDIFSTFLLDILHCLYKICNPIIDMNYDSLLMIIW